MNILVLDEDPERCAVYHSDRDVSKCIMEYSELMKMAHAFLDGKQAAESRLGLQLYGGQRVPYHLMAAGWVRQASGNYQWVHELTEHLLKEFQRRFHRQNAYAHAIEALRALPFNIALDFRKYFVASVPPSCRRGTDIVAAYRAYYNNKQRNLVWSPPAGRPKWYRPSLKEEEEGAL